MQVRTPSIGEIEEVGKQAIEAGNTFLATQTLEDLDKLIALSKTFQSAIDAHLSAEQAWQDLENLIASCMDVEEKEAFDEHYDSQVPPCEVDEVESDPWEDDREAAATDLQADARAREIETQS